MPGPYVRNRIVTLNWSHLALLIIGLCVTVSAQPPAPAIRPTTELTKEVVAAPLTNGVAPSHIDVGSAVKVIVTGTNFVEGAVVLWNGTAIPATFLAPQRLDANVPASLTAVSGRVAVGVRNPDGQTSGTYTVYIQPLLKAVTPANSVTGATPVVLTATGQGFLRTTGMQVIMVPSGRQWVLDGVYVSSTEMKFTVPAEVLGTANVLMLDVTNGVFSRVIQIVITPGPLVVTCPPSSPVRNGIPYSANCRVAGGAAPYTWSISAGRLPDGLALLADNTPTAVIAGTPVTSGAFDYTISVVDSAPSPQRATYRYTGTIQPAVPPLSLDCQVSGTVARVGASYTNSCSASGGAPPYSWRISSGTLPPGLALSSTGAGAIIAGTPVKAGSWTYEVRVLDTSTPDSKVAVQSFTTLVSDPPLNLSCSSLNGPDTVGAFYSVTCKATGGAGSYDWVLVAGALPAGLSLTRTSPEAVVISGIPSAPGPFGYSLQVSDAGQPTPQAKAIAFNGVISPPPPAFERTGVVSAASFQPVLSRGCLVSVFGNGLADSTVSATSVPLPRSLGNVIVRVNGVDAPLWFVSPGQVNFQLPYESPLQGTATIQVIRSGTQSKSVDVELHPYSPAVFTFMSTPGVISPVITHADGSLVTTNNPSHPGEEVVVWGTGIGDVVELPSTGGTVAGPAAARGRATVTIGEVPAFVEYAGLTPGSVGLAQFNVRLPEVLTGDAPALVIRLDDFASTPVLIPVASR